MTGYGLSPVRKAGLSDFLRVYQEWMTENFEALVSEHGGKYIGVINEEVIAAAPTPNEIMGEARRKGRKEEDVSLLEVPTEGDTICLL